MSLQTEIKSINLEDFKQWLSVSEWADDMEITYKMEDTWKIHDAVKALTSKTEQSQKLDHQQTRRDVHECRGHDRGVISVLVNKILYNTD